MCAKYRNFKNYRKYRVNRNFWKKQDPFSKENRDCLHEEKGGRVACTKTRKKNLKTNLFWDHGIIYSHQELSNNGIRFALAIKSYDTF